MKEIMDIKQIPYKEKYYREFTDKTYKASIELVRYLKDDLDFTVKLWKDYPKYVNWLDYENPHAQKIYLRKTGGVKIDFDYIHLYVSWGDKLIWQGYEISELLLVQLHYLSTLKYPANKKFLIQLQEQGYLPRHP